MGWDPNSLTEKQRRMIAPEQRKQLGRAGMTNEEATTKQADALEKDLQKKLDSLLRRYGVVVISSPMHRKTSTPKGTPDFLFAVLDRAGEFDRHGMKWCHPVACAWELKRADGRRSPEQIAMAEKMTTAPNAWRYRLIFSYKEGLAELRAMGIAPPQ